MLILIQSWDNSQEAILGILTVFFWLLFIISIFLGPVIGFIIAALAGESKRFREERIRHETQICMEEEYRYRQQYDKSLSSYNSDDN